MVFVWVRTTLIFVLTTALLATILLLTSVAAFAQDNLVELSVTPNILELSPGEKATILILASIPTTNLDSLKPVTLTIRSFSNMDVNVSFLDNPNQISLAGSDTFWLAEIRANETALSPGKLHFLVEHTSTNNESQLITHTATVSLEIRNRPVFPFTDVLSAIPDKLVLSPGEKAKALIFASIPTTDVDSLSSTTITIASFSNTGVNVRLLDNPEREMSSKGGDIFWAAEIKANEGGISPGDLYFVAGFAKKDKRGQIITHTETTTLGISDRSAEVSANIISATLNSDIETLLDLHQRNTILILTNISNVPITVTDIVPTLTNPQEEQLKTSIAQTAYLPFVLQPQQSRQITITMKVGSSIVAGNNLLVIRVDANWMRGTLHQQGSTIVTSTFQSGVFGETAILTLMGIPTLLLLPGLLMRVGFKLFSPPSTTTQQSNGVSIKDLNNAEEWFYAISFSLLLFLIYQWISGPYLTLITGEWQTGRNLLTGYGFIDIVYLWFLSALVGLIAARARPTIRDFKQKWFNPSPNDEAITILNKLVRNGNRDFRVETRSYNGQLLYMLPVAISEPGKLWLTPQIEFKPGANRPEGFKQEFDKIHKKIESAGSKANVIRSQWVEDRYFQLTFDSSELKTLREWVRKNYLILTFDSQGDVKRPTLIEEASLKVEGTERKSLLNINKAFN